MKLLKATAWIALAATAIVATTMCCKSLGVKDTVSKTAGKIGKDISNAASKVGEDVNSAMSDIGNDINKAVKDIKKEMK